MYARRARSSFLDYKRVSPKARKLPIVAAQGVGASRFPDKLENIRVFAGGAGNRLFTQEAGSRDLCPFGCVLSRGFTLAINNVSQNYDAGLPSQGIFALDEFP